MDDNREAYSLQHLLDHELCLALSCDDCGHQFVVRPDLFAERACIPMATPMFIIARHVRCGKCGSHNAHIEAVADGMEIRT